MQTIAAIIVIGVAALAASTLIAAAAGRALGRARLVGSGWNPIHTTDGRRLWAHPKHTAGRPVPLHRACFIQDMHDEARAARTTGERSDR